MSVCFFDLSFSRGPAPLEITYSGFFSPALDEEFLARFWQKSGTEKFNEFFETLPSASADTPTDPRGNPPQAPLRLEKISFGFFRLSSSDDGRLMPYYAPCCPGSFPHSLAITQKRLVSSVSSFRRLRRARHPDRSLKDCIANDLESQSSPVRDSSMIFARGSSKSREGPSSAAEAPVSPNRRYALFDF